MKVNITDADPLTALDGLIKFIRLDLLDLETQSFDLRRLRGPLGIPTASEFYDRKATERWANLRPGSVVYLVGPDLTRERDFSASQRLEQLRQLQEALRLILHGATGPHGGIETSDRPLSVDYKIASTPAGPVITVTGPLRDVVLHRTLALIGGGHPAVAKRLRQCPECQTLFLRVRRQRFCSKRCTDRDAARRRKPTPQQRFHAAEKAHDRYERAQRRRGVTGKIARRPRLKPPTKTGRKARRVQHQTPRRRRR